MRKLLEGNAVGLEERASRIEVVAQKPNVAKTCSREGGREGSGRYRWRRGLEWARVATQRVSWPPLTSLLSLVLVVAIVVRKVRVELSTVVVR